MGVAAATTVHSTRGCLRCWNYLSILSSCISTRKKERMMKSEKEKRTYMNRSLLSVSAGRLPTMVGCPITGVDNTSSITATKLHSTLKYNLLVANTNSRMKDEKQHTAGGWSLHQVLRVSFFVVGLTAVFLCLRVAFSSLAPCTYCVDATIRCLYNAIIAHRLKTLLCFALWRIQLNYNRFYGTPKLTVLVSS